MRLGRLFTLALLLPLAALAQGRSGGGSGFLQPADASTVKLSPYRNFQLITNDGNSRDNPSAVTIYQNLGLTNNPRWAFGNPYTAGVGLNALSTSFRDDSTGRWELHYSWEQSGTFADVLDGVERSAYESFLHHGDYKPWMRIEASSRGINFGSSCRAAPGQVSRASHTVTVNCTTPHRMVTGDALWFTRDAYDGDTGDEARFGPESGGGSSFTIASTPDSDTFTYVDTLTSADGGIIYSADGGTPVSDGGLLYTKETDVAFGRDTSAVAAVRVWNGSNVGTVAQFTTAGIVLPDLAVRGSTTLYLGGNGANAASVTSDTFHVLEGKTFYQEGTYRSTGWWNGGGQTQTTQEVFKVGGSGSRTTHMRAIGGVDWIRVLVKNYSADNLTIDSASTDTFDGASSKTIPGWAAVTLVSSGTDWTVFYHPPPP